MRTAPKFDSSDNPQAYPGDNTFIAATPRAYDPREHFAPGQITAEEMRAANEWARNNPRTGISREGVRDELQHEYEVAAHGMESRPHVQWDVHHEQLFGLGRALEQARVAARFGESA
jgi:hypothetical protein